MAFLPHDCSLHFRRLVVAIRRRRVEYLAGSGCGRREEQRLLLRRRRHGGEEDFGRLLNWLRYSIFVSMRPQPPSQQPNCFLRHLCRLAGCALRLRRSVERFYVYCIASLWLSASVTPVAMMFPLPSPRHRLASRGRRQGEEGVDLGAEWARSVQPCSAA